jgi:hypothetical protein
MKRKDANNKNETSPEEAERSPPAGGTPELLGPMSVYAMGPILYLLQQLQTIRRLGRGDWVDDRRAWAAAEPLVASFSMKSIDKACLQHESAPTDPKSLLFARTPSFGRASLRLCRNGGLVNQEVVAIFAFLDCCGHPPWHRTSASPCLAVGTTILGRDFYAFPRTAAATAADVFAKSGKLPS